MLDFCNHHEADTRLTLQAYKSTDPAIVRATDTDVLVILTYAYYVNKPSHDWLMKIDHERYGSENALIEKIFN